MISQFSVFGTCVSRNIFMDVLNEGYKSHFNINHSVEGINIISLMSNPIDFDEALINSEDDFENECIKEDLTKNYINTIKNAKLDYILIDTMIDALEPIIRYDENSYITDSFRFKSCEFRNQVKDKPSFRICDNTEEFMRLWEDAYQRFFKFVGENKSHPKVILNCAKASYTYRHENMLVESPDFKRISLKLNRYKDMLDKKLLENYDIDVLPFDPNTLIDVNHIFSPNYAHYEKSYYATKNDQLLKIVARNERLDYDDEQNVEIRRLARENVINDIISNQPSDEKDGLDSKSSKDSKSWKLLSKLKNFKKRKG